MRIELENLINTRDLGGMKTTDGRVIKKGMLIRSGQLSAASEADKAFLSDLLGVVYDFRTSKERNEKPDPALDGVEYIHVSILDESRMGISREEETDKEAVKEMMGDAEEKGPEHGVEMMAGLYGEFVTNAAMQEKYRAFLKKVLENENGAVLWHCTAGKDRAGFASILVEAILGVSREDMRQDYLATNVFIRPEVEELLERLTKDNDDPQAAQKMMPMFSALDKYFDRVFSAADEVYGGFDAFLEKAMGIDAETRERFRSKFLE